MLRYNHVCPKTVRCWNWLWIGLILTIVVACAPESPLAPQASPTPTSTATPLPTPTATLAPTPAPPTETPTLTPVPTPDGYAIASLADAGVVAVGAPLDDTATLICLRYEDTDGDGTPEWLALAHQNTTPPRLSAFVLDGDTFYPLEPASPADGKPDVGLGQYPTCEVEVRDVNADGMPEIAIFGHADRNETLLHLFTWNGDGYRRLGFFSGDAGVHFVNVDGDLEDEIWEGYRERNAPSLAWYVIFTWEEQTYGWTSDRYGWYTLNRPQTYPTHKPEYAVIAFYLALDDRDLPGAYNLLFPQEDRNYDTWARGFATTARVSVGSVHTIPGSQTENSARVAAMVRSWDNEGGVIIGRLWNTEWATVRTGDGWRLTRATAELLEEWTATYWP